MGKADVLKQIKMVKADVLQQIKELFNSDVIWPHRDVNAEVAITRPTSYIHTVEAMKAAKAEGADLLSQGPVPALIAERLDREAAPSDDLIIQHMEAMNEMLEDTRVRHNDKICDRLQRAVRGTEWIRQTTMTTADKEKESRAIELRRESDRLDHEIAVSMRERYKAFLSEDGLTAGESATPQMLLDKAREYASAVSPSDKELF